MLRETPRPLSPADHDALDLRLVQGFGERRTAAVVLSVLFAAGGCLWFSPLADCFAVVVTAVGGVVAAALANLVAASVWDRTRVRRALRSTHVVEYEVSARAAGRLASGELLIYDAGGGRLFARPQDGGRIVWMVRGVFRLVVAHPSGLEVRRQEYGLSFFHPRKLPAFRALVPNAADRRRILAHLRGNPVFAGSLDDVAAALRGVGEPLPEPPPPGPDWDAIQADLEPRFAYAFVVGRLAAAVGMLTGPPTPTTVAEAVWKLFPNPDAAPAANGHRRRFARQLREALAVALDRPPDAIPLTAPLDDLFPKVGRRRAWDVFKAGFPYGPRAATEPPQWAVGAGCLAALAGLVAAVVASNTVFHHPAFWDRLDLPPDDWPFVLVGAVVGLPTAAAVLGYWPAVLYRRLFVRFEFPPGTATANDVLRHALEAAGPGYTPPAVERPTVAALEEAIRDRWAAALPDEGEGEPA